MNSELDWIKRWSEITPHKVAITDLDTYEKYSYKDLNCYANQIYNQLKKEYKTGDRIAVLTEQSPFLIALFVACQRLGLILVPINFRLSNQEVWEQLKDSAPSLVIFSEHYNEKLVLAIDYFPCQKLIDFLDDVKNNDNIDDEVTYELNEDAVMFLFYSSGTTSKPKGVMYTNKMLFWNSLNTAMQLEITSRDSTINILPSYHTSGWNVFVTPLLHQGGHVALMRKFEPKSLLENLSQQKISLFLGLPTILQMLSQHPDFYNTDLSSLRYIITGGEFIPPEVIELWKNEKNVFIRPGYGLTEAGPSITSLHQNMIFEKVGSIGKPNFYVDIEIRDSKGRKLPPSKVGELCIKSKVVTPGYWNNSVITKSKIKDNWLYTGDLAYIDDEGFIYLKGRIDDMYISGGENIYPKEIESVLLKHKDVSEVVVLPVEDEKWGKAGLAFIKTHNTKLTDTILKEFLKDKLAKYKYPKHFVFLEEFPVTGFGKISRKDLYRLYYNQIEKFIK